ncbi:hypothetical protein M0Q50_03650 [bacterium]|jgi:hypothetical protein|nr:hypothetical protein [bacterium]
MKLEENKLKEKLEEYFKSKISGANSGLTMTDPEFTPGVIDVIKECLREHIYTEDLLNDVEKDNVKKYIAKVKEKYGKVGNITYSFSSSSGIGRSCYIKSSLKKKEKDITDYSCW